MNTNQEWKLCPKCKKREREVCTLDGQMEMYCSYCNDDLAERERERREFEYYHPTDRDC